MAKTIFNCLVIFTISIQLFSCQKTADEYYNSAITLSKEHKVESSINAIALFDNTIEVNPNFAMAYLDRGRTQFEIQNIRNVVGKTINEGAKNLYNFDHKFKGIEQDSLFKKSILDYDKALELDSTLIKDVTVAKGHVFLVSKNFTSAVCLFLNAIEIDSSDKSLVYPIVTCMLSLADTTGAKLFLDSIVSYNNQDSEIYYLRAINRLVDFKDLMGGCEDLMKAEELYDSSKIYNHNNLKEDIEKLKKINCSI
ncbi:MAG: hypothetical protein KKF62_13305 [Bacteroidetes bacterium]|nr:hypothetical protein [Bacteroidota bacterium]MBU1800406.1 hypothetical protein [Bacteroidota bacterium]